MLSLPNSYTKSYTRSSFSEGLAPVQIIGKWGLRNGNMKNGVKGIWGNGYIDKKGNFIIPPNFDHASSFSEGLASVQINEKWGYVNKKGAFVIHLILIMLEVFKKFFRRLS